MVEIFLFFKMVFVLVCFVLIILLCSGKIVWKCLFLFCLVELLVELFLIKKSLLIDLFLFWVGVNLFDRIIFFLFFFLLVLVFLCVFFVVFLVLVVVIVFVIIDKVVFEFFFKKVLNFL